MATRTQLRQHLGVVYQRLAKSDREWLEAQLPQRVYAGPKVVDWEERDAWYAMRVPSIAEAVRSETTKPVRVTTAAIVARLARSAYAKRAQLPKTWDAIGKVVESRSDFAKRRAQRSM